MVERVNFAILFSPLSFFLPFLLPFQIIVGNGRLFKPNLLKTFTVRINSFLHKHRPFKVSLGRRWPTLLNFLRQKPTLVASASTSPTRSRGRAHVHALASRDQETKKRGEGRFAHTSNEGVQRPAGMPGHRQAIVLNHVRQSRKTRRCCMRRRVLLITATPRKGLREIGGGLCEWDEGTVDAQNEYYETDV